VARLLQRLGRFSARHALIMIGIWALLAVGVATALSTFGAQTNNDLSLPGTGSQQVKDLLTNRYPPQQNGVNQIVFDVQQGKLTDKANKQAVTASVKAIRKQQHVFSVTNPVSSDGKTAGLLSKDEQTAFAPVLLNIGSGDLTEAIAGRVMDAAEPARRAGIETAAGGSIGSTLSAEGTEQSELVGIVTAMLILSLVLGSLVAMGLPIVTAVVGLGIGLAAVGLFGHLVAIPTTGPTLATMIGLGVGIDYSLFLVTRHQDQLRDGMPMVESIATAVATSGSAIVFAGCTVVIALLSLGVAGIPLVSSLGMAAAIAVVTAVAVAVSLLPAFLGLLGHRIAWLSLPAFMRPKPKPGKGMWAAWARVVRRHPALVAVVSTAALVPLIIPAASLELGQEDIGAASPHTTERQAYDLISAGFGVGYNGPLQVASKLEPVAAPSAEYKKKYARAQSLKKKLDQAQKELPKEQKQLEAEQQDLEAEQRSLESRKTQLQSEQEALEDRGDRLRRQRSALEDEGTQLRAERSFLEDQKARLQAEQRSLHVQAARLQSRQAALEREGSQLRAQQATLERRAAQLRRQRSELQREATQLQAQQRRLEVEQARLEQQAATLRREVRALAAQARPLVRELAVLELRENRLERLIARSEGNPRRQARLRERLADVQQQQAVVRQQLRPLRQEARDLVAQARRLEQQAAQLQRQADQLQRQADQLQQQKATLLGEAAQLQQQQANLRREAATLQSQGSRLQSEAGGLRQEGRVLRGEAAALRQQRDALQRQAAALQRQGNALQRQADALQRQAAALQGQAEVLRRQGNALQQQADALEQQADQLKAEQQQAEQEKKEAEKLKKQLTNMLTQAGGDDRGTDPRIVNLQDGLSSASGVVSLTPPQINNAGDVVIVSAVPNTGPATSATADMVDRFRASVLPQTNDEGGITSYVGGFTASYVDLASLITARLLLVIGTVVLLGALLLMIAFRSLLIPVQAAATNLLSAAAAFGVLVAAFQWGWGSSLLGIDTPDPSVPIASYVPLMLFAVLFGLSMDYEVFLVSHLQQHHHEGAEARDSVSMALASSARITTAAALIMASVFASFILNGDPTIKQFGVGLASAVLLAGILVVTLAPALLVLAGRAAWWLPRWLDRLLPHISVEGETSPPRPAATTPVITGTMPEPAFSTDGAPRPPGTAPSHPGRRARPARPVIRRHIRSAGLRGRSRRQPGH
jgi:uncharacterized membrane protein YdfJ with MMPL/SSD domain